MKIKMYGYDFKDDFQERLSAMLRVSRHLLA